MFFKVSGLSITFTKFVRFLHVPKMSLKGVRDNWGCKITPSDLLKRTNQLIEDSRKLYDTVAAVPDNEVAYENVLKVLAELDNENKSKRYFLDSSQLFVPDQALRDASTEAGKILQEFDIETSMRKDIFTKINVLDKKNVELKPEAKRYLNKIIIAGKRNGLHLSDETMAEIKSLQTKLNSLCIQFSKNLVEEASVFELTHDELFGMPEDYFSRLEKSDNGKYKVTLKYPDYIPIMKKCRRPETRKKMQNAFQSRCIKENTPLLKEVIQLRHKIATLLGYPTHASYQTELLMSKSPEIVNKFLSELLERLKPLWKEERKVLLELKEIECKELNIPFDGKLNAYDLGFYTNLVESTKYLVDHEKLKEYFPISKVTEGLLSIYQGLLGLKFTEMKDVDVWHEDVRTFSVEDSKTGELFGYFFLDLYPREGKYGHACAAELQTGCLLPDGSRQVAVTGMLSNFTKPQAAKPSLLSHDEVTTFFHEFGHLMHYICSKTDFARFHGFTVEKDFVETPSQMLENWCWEVEPLKKMSSHYENNSEIPENILNALLQSRMANTGYKNIVQVCYALFDFRIHSTEECDFDQVFVDTYREVIGIEPEEGTSFACSFNHLCNDYDAQYFGYLWSEVYCMDMFYTRFKDGKILDPVVGMDYREKILKPGSSKDGMDMLVDFLGRKPTQDAYLQSKGLKI